MAARGTDTKNAIWDKLIEVFPNAFWEDTGKILRIPGQENGNRVEVKVTLTAAKNNLFDDNGVENIAAVPAATTPEGKPIVEPSDEEKANVAAMLASLGL